MKSATKEEKQMIDINTLANYSKHTRDEPYGYEHWMTVLDLCQRIARKVGRIYRIDLVSLELAAKMHDLGRTPSDPENPITEWAEDKEHATRSAEMAENICKWEHVKYDTTFAINLIRMHDKNVSESSPPELRILADANKLDLYRFGDILRPAELSLDVSKKFINEMREKYGLKGI